MSIRVFKGDGGSAGGSCEGGIDGLFGSTINDGGAEVNLIPLDVARQLVEAGVVEAIMPMGAAEKITIVFGKAGNTEAVRGYVVGKGLLDKVYVVNSVLHGLISDHSFTMKGVWIVKNQQHVWGLHGGRVVFRGWRKDRLWLLDIAALLRAPDPRSDLEKQSSADTAEFASVLEALASGTFGGGAGGSTCGSESGTGGGTMFTVNAARPLYTVKTLKVGKEMVRRFSHISARTLANAVERGTMKNFPDGAQPAALRALADKERLGDVAYQLGHTRVLHELGSGLKVTVVGFEVSIDDVGQYEASTWGARYALVCRDTYSSFVTVYGMADKKAVADCLELYLQFMGAYGHKVERLRCDFTSLVGKDGSNKAGNQETALRRLCSRCGVAINQAAPEMQQQNPVERTIGTLGRDMATALVQQSNLKSNHWLLAFKYVAAIRNVLPTEDNPDTSPLELVMKVKPDFQHVAVAPFGHLCMAPRVGANGIGDTNHEAVVMIAPVLGAGKQHMVLFEGQKVPSIRGGVQALVTPQFELTDSEREALKPKFDKERPWRLVDFRSRALHDWTLQGVLKAYDEAEPEMAADSVAKTLRFEGWTGKVHAGGRQSQADEGQQVARLEERSSVAMDIGDGTGAAASSSGVATSGSSGQESARVDDGSGPSGASASASANGTLAAAPAAVSAAAAPVAAPAMSHFTSADGSVGFVVDNASFFAPEFAAVHLARRAVDRVATDMFEWRPQHGSTWPTRAQWDSVAASHASDEEGAMLADFQADHGGRLPTAAEWEQIVLAFAAVGHTSEVRRVFKAAAQRTDANPSQHAVERCPRLQALWHDAMRKEVDGGVADGSTPWISEAQIRDGNYEEVKHIVVYKTKRSGERHVRSAIRGDLMDKAQFAPDSLFAPTLHEDALMWAIAFGAWFGMRFSSADVSRCFRKYNSMESAFCKNPRRLFTRLSAFESGLGRPAAIEYKTVSYGAPDAPRLWHDISTDRLLKIPGMHKSRGDSCFFYMLRGDAGLLLLLKIVDDILEISTRCADGQAMLAEVRQALEAPDNGEEGWIMTHQDVVDDFNSLKFAFGTAADGTATVMLTQPSQLEKVREHFFGSEEPPVTLMPFPKGWSMMRSAQSLARADSEAYMQGLGVLSWLRMSKQYSAALSFLASQAQNPASEDMAALRHFAAHMWTTRGVGLVFFAGPTTANIRVPTEVHGYSDGAEGQHLDSAGHVGEAFFFGPRDGHRGGAIKVRSNKQVPPYDDSVPAKELAGLVGACKSAGVFRAFAEEVAGLVPTAVYVEDMLSGSPPPTAMGVSPALGTLLASEDDSWPLRDPMRAAAAVALDVEIPAFPAAAAAPTFLGQDSQAIVQVTTTLTGKAKGLARLARKLAWVAGLHAGRFVDVTKVPRTEQRADNLTKVTEKAADYWLGVGWVAGEQPELERLVQLVAEGNRSRKANFLKGKHAAASVLEETSEAPMDVETSETDEVFVGLAGFKAETEGLLKQRRERRAAINTAAAAAAAADLDMLWGGSGTIVGTAPAWTASTTGFGFRMLSGRLGSYQTPRGFGISSAGGWLDEGRFRTVPIGQIGKGKTLGIGAISREELMEQMAARRYSEIAVHRASLAAWRARTTAVDGEVGAVATVDTVGESDHAVVVALNAMVADAEPGTEDVIDSVADDFYDTAAVVAARKEDVALAARTRINTDANTSTEGAAYFRAMVGAGLGHLIARRSAITGDELRYIDGLQQEVRNAEAVGGTRKRGVDGVSVVGSARAEQARRERRSSCAVSFEVSLAMCFHAVTQINASEQEAAWAAACGGPGARWCQVSQASDKRQCVQAARVQEQQQQVIFSASAIYNVGVTAATTGQKQGRRARGSKGKGVLERKRLKAGLRLSTA